MDTENSNGRFLTADEIREIVSAAKKPGHRFTVDLYLLDYLKHCLLGDGQLEQSLKKLRNALGHLQDAQAVKDVESVIATLECVQKEYGEYQEDMRVLQDGAYPAARP